MLNFEYHGIRAGKYDTGQIEALNKEEAADKLKSQRIIITKLTKVKKKTQKDDKQKPLSFF